VKFLTDDTLPGFFARLAASYEVLLPVMLPDGTRSLGSPGDGPVALRGGALPGKPTAAFFPHHEVIFTAAGGNVREPAPSSRPLFVAGFTHRDLDCLRFIDRFFADGWRDDLYSRRRQNAIVAGVSGWCGPGGSFLPMSGRDCDLELACADDRWLVIPYSEAGGEIAAALPEFESREALDRMKRATDEAVYEHDFLIRRAAELVQAGRVPDSFWEEIGDRCIACTACNLACPTCTCFGVQDWRSALQTERSRMWDSCQLDGFMREASGHNPLGTAGLRTWRRIHHKLAADPERWGEISCFVCGRCDAVCPTGIGIFAAARELTARYSMEGEHD
jgi:formate hydrogenlyase subunit 6/NADH:ubiquinone oxidoreductase subunit I